MTLVTCPECKKDVSDTSDVCPHCGYKMKEAKEKAEKAKISKGCGIGCLVVVAIIVIIVIAVRLSNDSDTEEGPAVTDRQARIEQQFSPWNGAHRGLERVIKASMNDPDSFEHVETVYWDQGDHLVVKTTFRGKNAFGGKVVNWVKARVDLDGNVLEIIEQGP